MGAFAKRGARRILRLIGPHPKEQPSLSYWEMVKQRESSYPRRVLYRQEGNDRIATLLTDKKPLMIARLGATEMTCLRFYVKNRLDGRKAPYPPDIPQRIHDFSGVFPGDDEFLDRFSAMFLEHVRNTDVMAVWFNDFEEVVIKQYCPDAELVELGCLEPFHYERPWSANLAGKKVLVVHPFAESIQRQYDEKRSLLFPNPDVLPEFELKTFKAVQTLIHSSDRFATWIDAYEYQCAEIQRFDFDVAIIGAGAYGLPLASFVKNIGKQAIHMGGVTQILFGVLGKRWEQDYAHSTAKMFNEHWVRPLDSEKPKNHQKVEDGCYW